MSNNSEQRSIIVPEDILKPRIDVFLASHFQDISRSRFQKLLEAGAILVNGIPVSKRYLLVPHDLIVVRDLLSAVTPQVPVPQNIPITILYEDEFLLAVDKPAGLVVHPGNGNHEGTLVNALVYHQKRLSNGSSPERPGIVHRLDKDTSGVLLVAKTNSAHAILARAFSQRTVQKQYVAFTIGMPHVPSGTIDLPLARSKKEPVKWCVTLDGKPSVTEYNVFGFGTGISYIQFLPHTGRTHQIRVHASHEGFPVLADSLYGGGIEKVQLMPPLVRPQAASILKYFSRQALHAKSISFIHPMEKRSITIESPLPADFCKAGILFSELKDIEWYTPVNFS